MIEIILFSIFFLIFLLERIYFYKFYNTRRIPILQTEFKPISKDGYTDFNIIDANSQSSQTAVL